MMLRYIEAHNTKRLTAAMHTTRQFQFINQRPVIYYETRGRTDVFKYGSDISSNDCCIHGRDK